MGWLRDFMSAVDPAIPSFGRLAELCLEHSDWPSDTQPKPRSLSTLFSKLDREQDLDWLRDRIGVQQVLALLLKRPVADIRAAIGETPQANNPRFLRLVDVRYARELDLTREELPPGIPRLVCEPPNWAPTWWHAPAGSGRSLVASWLEARGLAHCACISRLTELEQAPSRGALFLQLEPDEDGLFPQLSHEQLTQLRATERPLCIAAPFPPPAQLKLELLRSPRPEEYLPELVDWVAAHLDGSGHFVADRAEQWMRRVAIPAGAVRNFGDALGLLGLTDEIAPRTLLAKSLDELGEHFVRTRIREANDNTSASPRIADDAYEALLECAARCLADTTLSLSRPHLVDEWTALLSAPEQDNAPDPEWFTTALRGALGTQVSKRDLRRAARKLQPSAFALVRSLENAALLTRHEPSTSGEAALRLLSPRWLVSLLESRASMRLLEHEPGQWGTVLLHAERPARLIFALEEYCARGDFSVFERALEDLDTSTAQHAAALEGMTIALGFALLEGHEIPDDLLREILQENESTVMVIGAALEPRTTRAHEAEGAFTSLSFKLAFTALCARQPFTLRHLDPLTSQSAAVREHFALCVLQYLAPHSPQATSSRRALSDAQAMASLRLLATLCDQRVPACLALASSWTEPSMEQLAQATQQCSIDRLIDYGHELGHSHAAMYAKLWQALAHHPQPQSLFERASSQLLLWQNAPAQLLSSRIAENLFIDWSALLPHQYDQWFSGHATLPLPTVAALTCPLESAFLCLSKQGPQFLPVDSLRVLIGRAPTRFVPLLAEVLTSPAQLSHLLLSCPASASVAFARALPAAPNLLRHEPQIVDTVRYFMKRAIDERHPHFLEVYALLAEIESELWPLRKLP